jgi:hypothetical protein
LFDLHGLLRCSFSPSFDGHGAIELFRRLCNLYFVNKKMHDQCVYLLCLVFNMVDALLLSLEAEPVVYQTCRLLSGCFYLYQENVSHHVLYI